MCNTGPKIDVSPKCPPGGACRMWRGGARRRRHERLGGPRGAGPPGALQEPSECRRGVAEELRLPGAKAPLLLGAPTAAPHRRNAHPRGDQGAAMQPQHRRRRGRQGACEGVVFQGERETLAPWSAALASQVVKASFLAVCAPSLAGRWRATKSTMRRETPALERRRGAVRPCCISRPPTFRTQRGYATTTGKRITAHEALKSHLNCNRVGKGEREKRGTNDCKRSNSGSIAGLLATEPTKQTPRRAPALKSGAGAGGKPICTWSPKAELHTVALLTHTQRAQR